jgi:FAD-dependent urate hydroxylase
MDNLKVIIIGSGMGGLTAGIALRQAGYTVELYDRVRELRPAGAGISLWSNGGKVLNRLGLGPGLAAIGGQMDRVAYHSAQGECLTDFSLSPLIHRVGQRPYPVTRTELQNLLLQSLGPETVQLNAKCVAVEQDAHGVTAEFADGHRAKGDLLIGADGTHSLVREAIAGCTVNRRYAGYVNWNGLVSVSDDLAPAHSWTVYVGEHKRASMMPVGGDRFYFFFDVPLPKGTPNQPEIYREDLLHYFKGWAEPVQTLIQRLDPLTTNRVEIHDVDPLPTLVKGRIVLLGDAAHSMTPDLGQGGCQAMEDAYVLTNCLLTTNISIEDALQRYDAARCDRTADIVLRARKRADMTHGKDPEKTQHWYAELQQEDGSGIMAGISKTILGGPLG